MQNNYSTDIIPLLHRLCSAFHKANKNIQVAVLFSAEEKKILVAEPEETLVNGISKLLKGILGLIPPGNSLFVAAQTAANKKECILRLRNTGINLKIVAGIFKKSLYPVSISSVGQKETLFEVRFPLVTGGTETALNGKHSEPESPFNYTSVLKGIRIYFSKIISPVDLIAESNPKEGKFFQKINALIIEKIGDEKFDANALSASLSISRAQLLRRLKKITGLPPGQYIKSIRLQKAKEMLESDVTVSEAAYENGFGTLSNFTKVFREKYGITPSQWRQTRPVQQMNKK